MSSRRFRIFAWTETSRAETGSSQIRISGFTVSARAMEIRWHCPPENWCGRWEAAAAGSMPTAWRTSATRSLPSVPMSPSDQISRPSLTMSFTRRRGFSDEIGSWKIIWSLGRTSRRSLPDRPVRSISSSEPGSRTTRPLVGGGSWTKARAVVDLPQPDSPTMPRVSPFRRSKETSDTAWTTRLRPTGNSWTRFSTRRMTSLPPRSWTVPRPAIRPAPLDRRPPLLRALQTGGFPTRLLCVLAPRWLSGLLRRPGFRPACGTQPGGRHQGVSGVGLVSRTGQSCSGTDPRTGTRWAGWW